MSTLGYFPYHINETCLMVKIRVVTCLSVIFPAKRAYLSQDDIFGIGVIYLNLIHQVLYGVEWIAEVCIDILVGKYLVRVNFRLFACINRVKENSVIRLRFCFSCTHRCLSLHRVLAFSFINYLLPQPPAFRRSNWTSAVNFKCILHLRADIYFINF